MKNNVTAIVDYGVGNLFSLRSSLMTLNADVCVTSNADELKNAARIILPGVGAFKDAVDKLRNSGLDAVIKECAVAGKPLMGICLGMQMLFEYSYEYGKHQGLSLIPGNVIPMRDKISDDLKVPHIGWNKLNIVDPTGLFKYITKDAYAYYVHSYYADTDEQYITAFSEYDISITGAVKNGNVCGTQFHPEKSGSCGLLMLKSFCEER